MRVEREQPIVLERAQELTDVERVAVGLGGYGRQMSVVGIQVAHDGLGQ